MNRLRLLARTFLRQPLLRQQPLSLLRPLPNHFPLPRYNSTQPPAQPDKPSYQLTFTCRPCTHRSSHHISKQAYHAGSVLITCPGCSTRHVITDHLKIFGETARSLEDILREKGELLKRGVVTAQGGIEFFSEGTEVKPPGGGEEAGDKV
ncbi:DNL zinc finger-domain-containing protein [Tuber indicum]|nr:DNL zinc finger-domain-containing protein [Tuber indicum]